MEIIFQGNTDECRLVITCHILEIGRLNRLVDEILFSMPGVRATGTGGIFLTTTITGDASLIMCVEAMLRERGYEVVESLTAE
ncbi:hypothetical protein D6T51_17615 [Salmonella enterica subsp. enterica serovar Muenchen]|uniref:Uncharacterized protein n=1 Tax=Salmonella enterica subsp. enterica serovar Ank TaxID=1173578 RepID=A0A5I2WXK8_SALET|nr:hypothetical protein [Salmonella enterica subsp. enterica serovar Muenchen]EBV7249313.1 hypothetical protein [Salmonella enterica subsp. enterica serovar Pomona]ECF3882190.1 hypothetical protein [Salmonella enterica subsp. enterica serovar Ank]EEJ1799852.1 hypothetical protein [Salmonella enterica subsp. enterica serovar Pomona]HAE1795979.1 hypothetical protein [Salmonella enterica subsp. enterica serovar Ank]